jgi:phosphate transport system substrate-binding protein
MRMPRCNDPRPALGTLLCLLILIVSFTAACAKLTATPVTPQTSIKVSASTAALPLLTRLARAFEARNPWATVVIEGANSYHALRQVLVGAADLGACAVAVEDEVWAAPIALDAVAIIVHRDNPLEGVTLAQVRDIFGGRAWRWEHVGIDWGEDEVVVVSREEGSGTRMAFEAAAMTVPGSASCAPRLKVDPQAAPDLGIEVEACPADPVTPTAVIIVGSDAVVTYVEEHRGAIGYVSQAHTSSLVKAVSIEGLKPGPTDIQRGGYLLVEPFFLVAPREPGGPPRAFVDFCLSAEGQAIVGKGYVPVRR